MTKEKLKKAINKTPQSPGIYIFEGVDKDPLYIGKARNLEQRLKSYLNTANPRLDSMIKDSSNIKFKKTASEIEALILEAWYIKKFKPRYNITMRDDKQYGYVRFSHDDFSKVTITHQPTSKNKRDRERYIGPFTDLGALKTTLGLLRRIFPYCTCKQLHYNYCLNYHIDKCLGFCCLKNPKLKIGGDGLRTYKNNIKTIQDILSGKKLSVIKKVRKEMEILSNKQEYEKAIELQIKIVKLERIFENARIINESQFTNYQPTDTNILASLKKIFGLKNIPLRIEAYDIANIQGKYAVGAMIVFINGKKAQSEYRKFKIHKKDTIDDTGMLKEILSRRFDHPEWQYPNLILVDGGKGQLNVARSIIARYKLPIDIMALTKNEKHFVHKIIMPNKTELPLAKLSSESKNLLLQINGEAHRFTITYYRNLHRKSVS